MAAFHSTAKSLSIFLSKMQILTNCPQGPAEELLKKSKDFFEDLALPALNELMTIYKKVYARMVKRRHKLFDYDKLRLAISKADAHKVAKLQVKFDAAAREYNSHNEALKQELPKLFRYRQELLEILMKEYNNFMDEFFLLMERFLNTDGREPKTYAEIQATFNRHEKSIHDLLNGLSLVSMSAQRSQSAVDQLTSKIKKTFKKEKISTIANRSRSSTTTNSYKTFEHLNVDQPTTNHVNNPMPVNKPLSMNGSVNNIKPTAQPNAKAVFPPPPPPQTSQGRKDFVVAMYNFDGQEEGDLSFKVGDRIEVIKKTENKEDWWTGKINGKEGIFPANYVKNF